MHTCTYMHSHTYTHILTHSHITHMHTRGHQQFPKPPQTWGTTHTVPYVELLMVVMLQVSEPGSISWDGVIDRRRVGHHG